MTHHLLIAVALPQEAHAIKALLATIDPMPLKIKVLITGVGGYRSLLKLQEYVLKEKVDFLLNIGVCGKRTKETSNSIFQVWKIFSLARQKEQICPIYLPLEPLGQILHSERVLTDPQELGNFRYVDMESQSIHLIATTYTIPFCMLKIPLDTVGSESKEVAEAWLAKSFGGLRIHSYLSSILSYVGKLPSNTSKEIKSLALKFHLTHTQTLQLTHLFHAKMSRSASQKEVLKSLEQLPPSQLLQLLREV